MDEKKMNSSYEQLYSELLAYALSIHDRNKRRIKYGSLGLIILPVALFLIRWITDSDKVVFLILWIIGMFILGIYLIGVEYLDASIQKKLKDMTDMEAEFDSLIETDQLYEKYMEIASSGKAGRRPLSAKIRKRIEELHAHNIEVELDDSAKETDGEGDDQ